MAGVGGCLVFVAPVSPTSPMVARPRPAVRPSEKHDQHIISHITIVDLPAQRRMSDMSDESSLRSFYLSSNVAGLLHLTQELTGDSRWRSAYTGWLAALKVMEYSCCPSEVVCVWRVGGWGARCQ